MRMHDRLGASFIGPRLNTPINTTQNNESIYNTVSQQTINWYNNQSRPNDNIP